MSSREPSKPSLHRLLKRQLDRHAGGADNIPEEWQNLIAAVDAAYRQNDIDRKLLERSLELSSEELLQANSEMRAIFQALPDLFFRLDSDGTILDHRGASLDDFYLSSGSLRGKRIQDIPVAAVQTKFRQAIERVRREQCLVTIDYPLLVGGVEHFYEARLLPAHKGQIVVIIRSMTQPKMAERALAEKAQELARSNAELEQFAYIASHDLQEPLRTVESYLQLLKRRYHGRLDNDADEFISFAVDGARCMRELITDLLAYARVSSRSQPSEPTALDEVVAEVIAGLRTAIRDSDAIITYQGLPTVMVDRRQAVQLFQNLISNSIKFRKNEHVNITIEAERRSDEWQLRVVDDGIGIDPGFHEKVFIIFQRLHAREQYSGTGMGLAICKKIVERHGGRIWVESEPDKGTTILFTLPVDREQDAG
jgi:signal transduction histidine kinase